MFFGPREMYVALTAAAISLWACWLLWWAPIAIIAGVALLYLATGQHWPGPLRTAPSDIFDTISANIWYDSDQGILGSIMGVVLTTVLLFIIFGTILEGRGAGGSMIRISIHVMKKFKDDPAYAAILASALFGTVSGSAVADVVGTIPIIRKRGFNTLMIAAAGCIILGMDLLATHMFVFFFGVAAGIIPPVASTRTGAMTFLIPFAWAVNDALLLGIGETALIRVVPAVLFLIAALYYCSSALIGHERGKLSLPERALCLGVTIAPLSPMLWAELGGLAAGIALLDYRIVLSAPKGKGEIA